MKQIDLFGNEISLEKALEKPVVKVEVQHEVTVVVVDKTDLLCTYWDGDNCISCSGDYYADDNGRCVRIDDSCEFWKASGICSRCSYGWIVGGEGRCVAQTLIKSSK